MKIQMKKEYEANPNREKMRMSWRVHQSLLLLPPGTACRSFLDTQDGHIFFSPPP
jgi:hypothetical protein